MSVSSERYALIAIDSIDRILEEVHLVRSGHTDIVNNIGIIKNALNEMGELRNRNQELEKAIKDLKDKEK